MDTIKLYFLDVLKNHYCDFVGRATRRQLWMFTLFNIICSLLLAVLSYLDNSAGTFFGVCYGLYSLAVFLPSVSIVVRRLHDTNRSGWWWWIGFVPFIGQLCLFIFLLLPSTEGQNRFD